jgi:hypothetical protein
MSDSILQAGLQGVPSGIDQFGRAAGQVATVSNSSSMLLILLLRAGWQ